MKLSDQLRQAIADSGLTRYRISQATGISEAGLGKFVHGERGLSLESIDRLAEFLNLELTVRKARTKKEK
jgi:transcriptional regulator with XRE-family HTH domain